MQQVAASYSWLVLSACEKYGVKLPNRQVNVSKISLLKRDFNLGDALSLILLCLLL